MVHVDWLTVSQEHPDAPLFGDVWRVDFDPDTGTVQLARMLGASVELPLSDEVVSKSSMVRVRSWGGVVEVSGNPSKWGRLEAIAGGVDLDGAFDVYNGILRGLGLPEFTRFRHHDLDVHGQVGTEVAMVGAKIRRLDLAGNLVCGSAQSMRAYFDWLSSHRMGRLGHVWKRPYPGYLISGTKKRAEVVTYDKTCDVLEALKGWRRYGDKALSEIAYLEKVSEWAERLGLIRWEVRVRTEWLRERGLMYWANWQEAKAMGEVIWAEFGAPVGVEAGVVCHWATWADTLERAGETRKNAVTLSQWVHYWLNGANPRDGLSVPTFNRRAKRVRDVLGIDVRETPNVSALVISVRRDVVLRSLTPEDLPDWYGQRLPVSAPMRIRDAIHQPRQQEAYEASLANAPDVLSDRAA